MSHRKDTDYLAISARIRAMENRLLTRERMERLIDGYESLVIRDIRQIAEETKTEVHEIRVQLDEDPDGETFGRVIAVEMAVSGGEDPAELKRRIGGYYGMEEGAIAIHLETE